MPELADVTINGAPFMLAASPRGGPAYERGAEAPASARPGRMSISTFDPGLGWVHEDQLPAGAGERYAGGGWSGLNVHAVPGGAAGGGLEPWPYFTAHTDSALVDIPSTATRIGALVAGNNVYLHCGTRLYRTVPVSTGSWANLTAVYAAAGVIHDLGYFRDDVLIAVGLAADIQRWFTASSASAVWRTSYKAHVMQGYAASMVFSQVNANVQELAFLGTTGIDGAAALDSRSLDAPIVRMGLFAGSCVIATRSSLFLLSGHALRVAGAGALWSGEVQPLFSHGYWVNTQAGDFVFLLSLNGKLYTWLAGGVMEYDPAAAGGDGWRRTGPAGGTCHGACIAAGHLVVALETAAGRAELWAFDGTGWWRLLTATAPGAIWPCALAGAGGFDLIVFSHGSTTYRLGRLQARAVTSHSYAGSATWTSPLLAGGNADTPKAWRQVAAYFVWPDDPGNSASTDDVTITLEYSTDAGATWATADTATVAIGHQHQLAATFAPPPVSRLLQLRVSWTSVSDWAPVLSRLVVDYATLDTSPRRRQWTLRVGARDQAVRRDGGVLAATGREQIDDLFTAWREQATVTFRDADYDEHPIEHTVRVLDIRQEGPRASDDGRWGGGLVTVTLAEL